MLKNLLSKIYFNVYTYLKSLTVTQINGTNCQKMYQKFATIPFPYAKYNKLSKKMNKR